MSKKIVSSTTNTDNNKPLYYPRIDVLATGKNFKRIRMSCHLTQSYVASQFGEDGITPSAISQWENGKCMPDMDKLVILSCIYGSSFKELLVLEYPKKEAS